ncbi:MAG: hypothetical protein IAC13_03720 [Firmicutes bacterium]|uniref:Uncharacterized protein n=1 Tax=Candidatus Scybalomonas excrementavium TaxID=2840943 RepID=A0A9D9N7C3_9FIRM|nr:hypothetical protein [Candidatus Scybalomonas excrementavium]
MKIMKKIINKKIIFFIFVILIFFIILSIYYISKKQNIEIENIQNVIENIFTSIDDSEYYEFKNLENETSQVIENNKIDNSKGEVIFPNWFNEKFQSHMTETYYKEFLGIAIYEIPILSYVNNKSLSLKNLTIEKKENYYIFNGELLISDTKDKNIIKLEGTVQTSKKGLVNYLRINNLYRIVKIIKT